jgi:hypothetical protein
MDFLLDLDAYGESSKCAVAENHHCWLRWSRRAKVNRSLTVASLIGAATGVPSWVGSDFV